MRKIGIGFGAGVIGSALLVIATAMPAHAVAVNLTCNAWLYSGSTVDTSGPPIQSGIAQSIELGSLSGPTEVNAGSSFTVNSTSTTKSLPTTQDSPLGPVTVKEVKNVVTDVLVSGAAAIGTITPSGGNALNPSVTKSGSTLHITLDGSQSGSAGGGPGTNFFPGGGNVVTPNLSIGLTAGAAGTTISAKVTHQESDVLVTVGGNNLGVRLICDAATNNLGAVQVVTPPPPGAPDAVADVATTPHGKPVTINVLANDKPNAQLPIDVDSLAVTVNPKHGSVVVNADHTVTYTPAADGTDTFTYKLCSDLGQQVASTNGQVRGEQEVDPCDTAVVTVTVSPVVTPNSTPPTTKATSSTTTTAAEGTAAASNELPRTGSSSAPLAFVGIGLIAAGAAAIAGRRRRTAER